MAILQATDGKSARLPLARPVIVEPREPDNGARRTVSGTEYVFYNDYWVRYYRPLDDSLASRKRLIDNLTRRAFHHTEAGINTPGERLDMAREAYLNQPDPQLRRVNGAMLAGALFNRATDIFTAVVELEEKGVRVSRDNELMKACGKCFKEALELGTDVRHFSGEEGIDELWGEPFRAFTIPILAYYESRFIKVAQTMSNIDRLADVLRATFAGREEFAGITPLIDNYATCARNECETMKSDVDIFAVWPRFVATGERLQQFSPRLVEECSQECRFVMEHAQQTLIAGRDLINWIARARVPMPQSTRTFENRCKALQQRMASC